MARLATIELTTPDRESASRAFLRTEWLPQYPLEKLERMLASCCSDEDDRLRLTRIREIAVSHQELQFSVHPGETIPPEFHAFVKDPDAGEPRLFACVLAPEPVVAEMLEEEGRPLFETATFQGMGTDTSVAGARAALEVWVRRIFPDLNPSLVVRPWPIEEVHSGVPRAPGVPFIPSAEATLDVTDFPTREELAG